MLAVVAAGPLFAAVDRGDRDHRLCLRVLERGDFQWVVPARVVAEATYLIGSRMGAKVEARFVAGLQDLDVEAPLPGYWGRMAERVTAYKNFPLGGTDASVVALAERLGTEVVITLDRRHFGSVQPRHCPGSPWLPGLE